MSGGSQLDLNRSLQRGMSSSIYSWLVAELERAGRARSGLSIASSSIPSIVMVSQPNGLLSLTLSQTLELSMPMDLQEFLMRSVVEPSPIDISSHLDP